MTDLSIVLAKGLLGGAIIALVISLLGGDMLPNSEILGILLAGMLGAGLPYLWRSSARSEDSD
jgi:hypothetical protein